MPIRMASNVLAGMVRTFAIIIVTPIEITDGAMGGNDYIY